MWNFSRKLRGKKLFPEEFGDLGEEDFPPGKMELRFSLLRFLFFSTRATCGASSMVSTFRNVWNCHGMLGNSETGERI